MARSPRWRSAGALPNPYDLDGPSGRGTSAWAPAALVTASAAGLVLFGAGAAAAAEPGEGDTDSGFDTSSAGVPDPGPSDPDLPDLDVPDLDVPDLDVPDLDVSDLGVSDLDPEVLAASGSGGLVGDEPDGDGLEPFSVGRDDGVVYEIHHDESLPPFTPTGAAPDAPTPDPALLPTDSTDVDGSTDRRAAVGDDQAEGSELPPPAAPDGQGQVDRSTSTAPAAPDPAAQVEP
ncbi:MAG: hypothetical protein LH603_00285, partial [Pseudonocardia sp.]|nr:hypothetical protein [Pseudonocardia sp.]